MFKDFTVSPSTLKDLSAWRFLTMISDVSKDVAYNFKAKLEAGDMDYLSNDNLPISLANMGKC